MRRCEWDQLSILRTPSTFNPIDVITEKLRKLRWTENDLEEHRKGDKRKVAVVRRLRAETTMT